VTFSWNSGSGVSQYWLYVGSSQGSNNMYSQSQGTNRSVTLTGMPTDGRTIYVRLWSSLSGNWQFNDYTYRAYSNVTPVRAVITSPQNGSTMTSSSMTFHWNSGVGVSQYALYVGTCWGCNNVYGRNQGTNRSATVTGIPTDGRTIYVRLWSSLGGNWQFNDYTYRAHSNTTLVKAVITSPPNGSTLPSSSVTFHWNAGVGVSQYALYVGTCSGCNNIYGQNRGTNLSATVTGIPTDGRTIYVRLLSYIGGSWHFNDYTYRAYGGVTPVKAVITSPPNGSTLTTSSVTFRWNSGVGVSQYFLSVGTCSGCGDIYSQNQGTSLSRTVSGIPASGKVYVRLLSLINGVWQANYYDYTARR
jgi:hypothetical protein